MDVEATLTISDIANQNNDALVVIMDIENVFEVERDTSKKGHLFFTCSNEYGYFDWVKDEVLGEESSSINCSVNHAPNKEDEELRTLFDGLAELARNEASTYHSR
ncbi:Hypothetical predicted protein [Olea europaea subsp. europaea]|uniref:Uncharacterized protein n=1 Tax=Olea europaea subsp. europaea TaxID=158383 RepID=A0A8S0S469_OLEEU|nr:Hypothetical predicted protein [Olea europaea subsp. europaea]